MSATIVPESFTERPTNGTRIPWITLTFISVNLLVAFLLLWHPTWIEQYAFRAAAPKLQNAITSLFLHLNILHLLGNMIFLAAVGPSVEGAVGWLRFFALYLVGGIAGAYVHALFLRSAGNTEPLIGASASVAACVGYSSVRYMAVRVPMFPRVSVTVGAVAAIWLGLQILGTFIRLGDPGGGVSFWSHIGGFLVGLLASLVFRAPDHAGVEKGRETSARLEERGPAASLAAADAFLQRYPTDARAMQEKLDALRALGDRHAEISFLLVSAGNASDTQVRWILGELKQLNALNSLEAGQRMIMASRFEKTDLELARALIQTVAFDPVPNAYQPDALLTLAKLYEVDRPEKAKELLAVLQNRFPMHQAAEIARTRKETK